MKGADTVMANIVHYSEWLEEEVYPLLSDVLAETVYIMHICMYVCCYIH